MKKTNFQFHATFNDIFEFIVNILKNELFLAYGITIFPEFKVEEINSNISVEDIKKYEMFFISKKKMTFCKEYNEFMKHQSNNLGIRIGCSDEKIRESSMWVFADSEIDPDWKRIINKYKKTMLKGAWLINPNKNTRTYFKNHYYTSNAQKAYENGIQICPIAGWNIYELISEE